MIFQGLSITGNCLRSETAPLTTVNIKRGLLCNLGKNFKGFHFMRHSGTDFQLLLNSKSSKLPSILLKNMLKIPILDLKKRGQFFKFCFSITF